MNLPVHLWTAALHNGRPVPLAHQDTRVHPWTVMLHNGLEFPLALQDSQLSTRPVADHHVRTLRL